MGAPERPGLPRKPEGRDAATDAELAHARQSFDQGAWGDAHARLSAVDERAGLGSEDLDRLATVAFLLGREDGSIDLLIRLYHEHLSRGAEAEAARCACWLGFVLTDRGRTAAGAGWFARAQGLVDDGDLDCSALGFLRVAAGFAAYAEEDHAAALVAFDEGATIGARFGDRDLGVLAGLGRGHALVRTGEKARGLAMLDEVMVAVTAGEVSPIMKGLAYCAVIEICQEVFELRRAREWTADLTRWCDSHPDLAPFRGQCLVRRAEIMQHHGAWGDAMEETEAARQRLSTPAGQPALGLAYYQQGELHRLRGEYTEAEEAYRQAGQWGHDPQPGLARLWLALGRMDAALAAIGNALDVARDGGARARMLVAYVEIAVAARDVAAARASVDELQAIAANFATPLLDAVSASLRGSVLLAEGDGEAAVDVLRRAWDAWQELEAPYEAARTRMLLGLALRRLGDEISARMELEAAGWAFRQLGATPDVERVEELTAPSADRSRRGLTRRATQVLRMVAAGRTNKAIAAELFLSERTVDRHVSNLLAKLGVGPRTAATAYAYEHDLV